jgi:hypothetical protein
MSTPRSRINEQFNEAIANLNRAGYIWTDTITPEYGLKKYCFQGAAKCDEVQIELDVVNVIAAGNFYREILKNEQATQ